MLGLLLLPIFSSSESLSLPEGGDLEVTKGIVLVLTTAIINSGNALYKYYNPTYDDTAHEKEAIVRAKEAQKRLDFLEAEAAFRKCLKDVKKESSKNAVGIPTDCEAKARDLILCGGRDVVIAMVRDFNE